MQFTLSLNGVYTIQKSNFTLKRSTRVKIGRCEAKTADCGPGVKCRLSVKWRPSINCSRGRVFKAKKIPQIHVNDHLLYICFHKSIPCFNSLKRRRRSEHIIAISNLFFLLRDLTLHFSIHVTVNWYNATMFKLK